MTETKDITVNPLSSWTVRRRVEFLWGEGLTDLVLGRCLLLRLGILAPKARTGQTGGCDAFWKLTPVMDRLAAGGHLVMGLTDLDDWKCPMELIEAHFPNGHDDNFLLRVPICMLESWLIADIKGFAQYLEVDESLFPLDPETIRMPKITIVELARKSANPRLRTDIAPPLTSTARVGRGYSAHLLRFTETLWDPWRAMERSESLRRCMRALERACGSPGHTPKPAEEFTKEIMDSEPPRRYEFGDKGEDEERVPRRMPRFDSATPGDTWLVTLLLGDALDENFMNVLRAERKAWGEARGNAPLTAAERADFNKKFPDRIEAYLDKGVGACLFNDARMRRAVDEALTHYDGSLFKLGRVAMMPNHIHAILTVPRGQSIVAAARAVMNMSNHELNKLTGLRDTNLWHKSFLRRQLKTVVELARANRVVAISL